MKEHAGWAMLRSKLIRCFEFILLESTSGVPKMLSGGVYGGEGVCFRPTAV